MLNADIYPGSGIDVVFDACGPWPFRDNGLGLIFGNHVLEHLPNHFAFWQEAWRCLAPGGLVELALPCGQSNEAIADPTHLKQWIPSSFSFLQPGWFENCQNPQHANWKTYFEVTICWREINTALYWLVWKLWRPLGIRVLPHLWNAYVSLMVQLRALKQGEQVDDPMLVTVKDYIRKNNQVVFVAERREF